MAYTRITAVWNGTAGLPGYTRMKFAGDLDAAAATSAAARMRAFFQAFSARIPSVITITWDAVAQVFETDGTLTSEVSYTAPNNVTGTSVAGFAAPVGVVINWITGAVFQGRKVKGRTFIVPLSNEAFDVDGTPGPGTLGEIRTAATALLSATPPLVISGGGGGAFIAATVTSSNVPDRAAVLRSRRD